MTTELPDGITVEPTDDAEGWLDDWLDGAKRTVRSVNLYARNDLLADIDELEGKLRVERAMQKEAGQLERALGDPDPTAQLQQQIDELYVELDRSKRTFRISFLGPDELDAIRERTIAAMKDQMDKAAADARRVAQDQAKREGLTTPADINQFVRATARAAASTLLEREVSINTIAEAMVTPKMTTDQVRSLYEKLGDSQIKLLSQAYSRAANEAPRVTVPKS